MAPAHTPRTITGVDELATLIGQTLGSSSWHEITQAQVDEFADATGDHQWIHVDPARAADGPYGGTIAHGFLTLSLLPVLMAESFTLAGVGMKLNYGCNKVRFPHPTRVGSRIRAVVDLVSLDRGDARSTAVYRVTVEIQGEAKPACVVESVIVIA